MVIPKSLKIGGKTYSVEVTNNLKNGSRQYTGEIDYLSLEIKITPNAQQRMEVDFLHEMVHGIYDHLGYSNHDEKQIDEFAHVFHGIIVDNPNIFSDKK